MKKKNKIPTLVEYLENLNEDFFNPFDKDEHKKSKSKHISDRGGFLSKRKSTFNANRIEISKRGAKYYITARTQFARSEIIEVCPVLILGAEANAIDVLRDIVFELDKKADQWALTLGYGSLYGHSEDPNMDYAFNRGTKQMVFLARRPIQLGEELTINYGKDFWTARKEFNTMADMEEVDTTITKLIPKEVIEEGEVQPDSADNRNTVKDIYGGPNSPGNPANSGKAILGVGQS